MTDFDAIRGEFPALQERIHGHSLVYLDSAATTLTPRRVIDSTVECYARGWANVNRGAHTLSERATKAYEGARDQVAAFLNAQHREEIVFLRGCTEALNLVAGCWGSENIGPGDQVLVGELAHHSNWLPWQQLCQRTGAELCIIPLKADGKLEQQAYEAQLTSRTKIVALTHVSNALGTVNPVKSMTAKAHAVGARVVVDGAQAVSHFPVNVQEIGCDFYAFSAHKLYGPYGTGVLYAKNPLLHTMPVWMTGGGMVQEVGREQSTFAPPPRKFEPGTPNIAGVVGLGAAIGFLQSVGWDSIQSHETKLMRLAEQRLSQVPGLRLLGGQGDRTGVLSFVLQGVHPHDVSTVLDHEGVAVRAGHHCAKPTLQRLAVEATTRVSLGVYNQPSDINALLQAIEKARKIFVP